LTVRPPDTDSPAVEQIADFTDHHVRRTPILGGLINEYHRAA
jgi:hypothetical protein